MNINKKLGKKGSSAILDVINILIMIIVFAMLTNLIIISTQYLHLSNIGNEVSRTIAVQSGLRTTTPANYPGGNNGYYTSSELYNFLEANMNESRFENFYLKVNNVLMSPTRSVSVDYKDKITVELAGQFKWIGLDGFIPGLSDNEKFIVVKKTVYAEYRH